MSTSYEDKVEAQRQRLLERAERAEAQAKAAEHAWRSIMGRIPMGQPILRGHHSERRHRRDLERARTSLSKAAEAQKKAEELRRRAANLGNTIRSDDPCAVEKLEAELAEREAGRELMKQINVAYRRGGWAAVREAQLADEKQIAEFDRTMKFVPGGTDVPFPRFSFTNASADIRRIAKRIAELKAGPPTFEPMEGDGWRIEARADLNRVALSFDARPSDDVIQKLKRGGWRWSRREGAWLRYLNKQSLWAIENALAFLPARKLASSASEPGADTRASKNAERTSGSAPAKRTLTKGESATSRTVAPTRARADESKPSKETARKTKKRDDEHPAFARWVTHPKTGKRLVAARYGYKAWPLRSRGRT